MKKLIKNSIIILALGSLCACSHTTRRPTTTQIAAATGGVIGGGLGAIVGNQVGNTGAGFLVGAVAGSGTGALIGQKFEKQENQIALQDARLNQQERRIQVQEDDIQELRQLQEGSDTNNRVSQNNWGNSNAIQETTTVSRNTVINQDFGSTGSNYRFKENEIEVQNSKQPEARGSYRWGNNSNKLSYDPGSEECISADKEVVSAQTSLDVADKLYHQRRALRLCPNNPNHHNGLGEIYISLNRDKDARFEFNEALKLNPNHDAASRNLALVQ